VSCLALFQTTLNHECDPSIPAAFVAAPVPGDFVVGVEVGVDDVGGGLVADVEGDADFDAGADGVAVVGGASRVGDADVWLGVG
jgi:hypothetical protein